MIVYVSSAGDNSMVLYLKTPLSYGTLTWFDLTMTLYSYFLISPSLVAVGFSIMNFDLVLTIFHEFITSCIGYANNIIKT